MRTARRGPRPQSAGAGGPDTRPLSRSYLGLFHCADRRSALRRAQRLALQSASLARLPRPVAGFWLRALRTARATGDMWGIDVACRPIELRVLLSALGQAPRVAEIGTARAWTTSCLALAQPGREVHSWDVDAQPERERYLALLSPADRARVHLHDRPGGSGPADPPPVDAIFVDSSHEREETIDTFHTWERALAPGGLIAFHDWEDEAYPGIGDAIRELGLRGESRGHMFIWHKPVGASDG